METEELILENAIVRHLGDQVIVEKRIDGKFAEIFRRIMFDLIGLPLLLVVIGTGIWIISLATFYDESWKLIPIGLVFLIFGGVPLYVLMLIQPNLFSYECRFKRASRNHWLFQRRLGWLNSKSRALHSFSIVALPTHYKGDWGYGLSVKTSHSKFTLCPPSLFTASKKTARRVAERDGRIIATCLGIECQLEKWE